MFSSQPFTWLSGEKLQAYLLGLVWGNGGKAE
jgi:hypothetical protein